MERNILVAAASADVRSRLGKALRSRGFKVTLSSSGAEALKFCRSISVDTAVIDTQLPDMGADKLRQQILSARPDCRVVPLTSFERLRGTPDQLKFGPDHFVVSTDQVLEAVGGRGSDAESGGVPSFADLGNEALIATLDVLIGLLELDDRYFTGGSHRAGQLARAVAERLIGDPQAVQEVAIATLLRDIGRVGLPPALRERDGELSDDDRATMRTHVESSLRLLDHIQYPWKVLPIIRHHHERYDGTGYPDGLRGREIPLGARILAVVDAFVAMTSPRSHRDARTAEDALLELMHQSGHQFDPEVVEILQAILVERLQLGSGVKKPTVLLVEPDKKFRSLLRLNLANEGNQVLEADDVESGLAAALKQAPQLTVVDADADAEAAFGLLQEMRGDENLQRIPFVLISGSDDRMLKMRALREGVDEFLDKNTDLEELVARCANVLIRESLRSRGAARPDVKGIRGELENLALPDIVQMLSVGMKTACVTVERDGGDGRIWFDQGSPVAAHTGEHHGEDAFYELVTWTAGSFLIEHGVRAERRNLEGDAMFLLMEGLRRLDEGSTAASRAS